MSTKLELAFLFMCLCFSTTADAKLNVSYLVALNKTYTIKLLHLTSLSLNVDVKMKTVELLTLIVNSRQDILPNYRLELQIEEEDLGRLAASKVISFSRKFEDPPQNSTLVQSPILIGPLFSTGCKSIGKFMHHINQVDISISCTAPELSDHSIYRNLYLTQTTDKFTANPILQFIRGIGKWNRIAIVSYSGSVNDYSNAFYIHKKATEANFSIAWFDMIDDDINEATMKSLKQSDARIIIAYISTNTAAYSFLCQAYKVGVTGPKYALLLNLEAFQRLGLKDYPGCTVEILKKQMAISYFFGLSARAFDRNLKTQLGYSQIEFVDAIKELTNGAVTQDQANAHDSLLIAIMALNETETVLNQRNMTLKDYSTQPALVAKIANESVLNTKVTGTRIGLMTYSKSGQPERDNKVVAFWSEETGVPEDFAYLKQRPNSADFVYDSYYIEVSNYQINNLVLKKIPKNDVRPTMKIHDSVDVVASIVILILVVTTAMSLLYPFYRIIFFREKEVYCLIPKAISLVGCLLVDIAAGLFVIPNRSGDSLSIWLSCLILMVMGLSLLNGSLAFKFIALKRELFKLMPYRMKSGISLVTGFTLRSRKRMTPSLGRSFTSGGNLANMAGSVDLMVEVDSSFHRRVSRLCVNLVIIFALVNAAILLLWLHGLGGIDCSDVLATVYDDPQHDVIIETWKFNCTSFVGYNSIWLIAFAFFHLLVIVIGVMSAYQISKRREFHVMRDKYQVKQLLWGLANASMVLLGGLLIMFILNKRNSAQKISLASACLILTSFTSALLSLMLRRKPLVQPPN